MKVHHKGIIYSVEYSNAFTDKDGYHERCISLESSEQDICFTGNDIDDIEFPASMIEVQWLLRYGKPSFIYWIDGVEVTKEEKYPDQVEPSEPDMMGANQAERDEKHFNYQNLK